MLTRVLAIAFNFAAAAGHAGQDAPPPSPHLAVRLHILIARSHRGSVDGDVGLDSVCCANAKLAEAISVSEQRGLRPSGYIMCT